MPPYREIVVPTDFSELSAVAFPHAREIALGFEARVTLLHVRAVYRDDPASIHEEFEEDAGTAQHMDRWWPGEGSAPRPSTVVVRAISPAAGVLAYMKEHDPDLVIMGSHGRSGLLHFVLGSVCERVIRHSTAPVLTVFPQSWESDESPSYQHILVGFDFSEHAKRATTSALHFGARLGASVHIVYAVQDSIHPAYYDLWGDAMAKPAFYDKWREQVEQGIPDIVEEIRASLRDQLEGSGADVTISVAQGRPDEALLEYAEENSIDLVAVGNHGLSGLDHLLLGSTTEKLLRASSRPVLTFPPNRETSG